MNTAYAAWAAQLAALIKAGSAEKPTPIPAVFMAAKLLEQYQILQSSIPPTPALKEPIPGNGGGE